MLYQIKKLVWFQLLQIVTNGKRQGSEISKTARISGAHKISPEANQPLIFLKIYQKICCHGFASSPRVYPANG
jgi:hypothetical protein